ncbi:MAG TPA: cohesin domain-containing protein, partial [Bacteroidales bacterium]|nr:cohesin domain-containing protein [Bacteroidales bacterium]
AATGNVTDIGLCSSTVGGQQLWTGIQVDKLQGGMYGVTTDNNESYLYFVDQSTGGTSVIGPTGIPNCADFAIDGGGQMYGIDIAGDNAYTIDMSTGASTLLGPLGFNAGNVMGMSWDSETDNIYFTSYNNTTSKSELYILDKVSGNATMVGPLLDNEVDGLAFSGNLYTWLTIDPKFGTVPPGDSVVVTASIDGSWFPPQKDYDDGTITFTSDPNVGTVVVPVTILPIVVHGILTGNVTHAGIPVPNVTITATHDGINYTAVSDSTGIYYIGDLPMGTYDVTAEATGYNPYSAYGIEVYEYQYLPINLTAPTMDISPDSLAISLNPNESGTLSLTLSNSGDGTLAYNVHVVSDSLWNYYVVPMSGYLGFGESTNLNFPVYANVPPGTYHAMIIFTSSPDVGTDSIPVTFTVLAGNYPTLTIPIIHNAEAGSIFIPVHAKYFANLGSFQFSIEYDPALLTYTSSFNWYPGIDAVTVGNPSPGHLTFVWAAETEGINIPDGNFFTLGFTWNGQAGQTSALAWSDDPTIREFGDFDGNIFVPSYINGQIYGYIPGPKIGFETVTNVEAGPVSVPVHTYNMSNLGAFQFTIDYDTTLLTFNGTSGWYPGLENVTVGNPSPGHITFDWTAENGGVTIENGNFFTLGLTWKGTNQSSTLYWGNEPTAIEFSHYNGNTFIPDYFDGGVFGYAANSTVSIEDAIVEFGSDSVVVPVHAQFATNPDYFQFSIEYDPEMTFFQGVTNWNPTIVDPVTVEEPVPGHITFQWCASTQGINIADGHFFDLVFNWPILTDNWWLSVPITWSDDPMFRYFSWDYGSTIIPANYINGSASGWVIGDIPETSKEAVKIYPNPASDYLNVEVGNDICKINVINNLGITVYEQNITGDKTITINTSGYRAGNYIVQLITKDGQTINRKMMKQ